MPSVFLSPSLQEWNPYINGGNEEYFMNLVADAIEPYLTASGISFARNTPTQTLSQAIAQSNAGNYDLHLAIHSNAAGAANSGNVRGTDVYYYPTSSRGKRAADIIAENYKDIYPLPDRVKTVATTSLAELKRTKAPAVLIETAYHDNLADAEWIQENIGAIGRNLAQSIAEFLGVPFVDL
ncbi:MAG: N-acetylmuramoyl-L-alanine amidase [Ruminococcus sp.]|nr:N-acetylmuramoyl-L-alanine amidase [Ruminococcus sp.]